MKKVIRKGVFETNSSSTHAVSYSRHNGSDKTEKNATYEIRTPINKLIFLQALINNCEYSCSDYDESDYLDLEEFFDGDQQLIEMLKNTPDCFLSAKDRVLLFNKKVRELFCTMANCTQEQLDQQIEEITGGYGVKCHHFFENDVLNDCTCDLCTYYSLSEVIGLDELENDEKQFEKVAAEFLSDKYKFVLQEYWNGCILMTNGEIY